MISLICAILKSDADELVYKTETDLRHRGQIYDYQGAKDRKEVGIN